MDDSTEQQGTSSPVLRVLTVACVFLVLTVPAKWLFGELGVEVVLGFGLAAIVVLAYEELSGRRVPRPRFGAAPVEAEEPEVEDTWRSERWVAEAVERGMRALEEWRLEQREA